MEGLNEIISHFKIVLIHGGPGTAGSMVPIANELSKNAGILEPLQTELTIDGQIHKLQLILEKNGESPFTLIGHSWGAWLEYIFTSIYPSEVSRLIMIGSGTFLEEYAGNIMTTRIQRLTVNEKTELTSLLTSLEDSTLKDKDTTFRKAANLIRKADSYSPIDLSVSMIQCRYDIFQSIWKEAEDLRKTGELLKMAENIMCPVTAIHGDYDPHPPAGITEPLSGLIKDFKFILLKKCGHEPWNEKNVREEFYRILAEELSQGI